MGDPSNSPTGNVVQGPGSVETYDKDSVECQAFVDAVNDWCAKPPGGKGGTFNDYFFNSLNKTPAGQAVAQQMLREVPVLVNAEGASTLPSLISHWASEGDVGMMTSLNNLFTTEGRLRALVAAGSMTWNAFRQAMNGAVDSAGFVTRMRYPDAMRGGTPVEIKGPNDTYRPGQKQDYQRIRPDGKLIEISCEACQAPCADGNTCPPGTPGAG